MTLFSDTALAKPLLRSLKIFREQKTHHTASPTLTTHKHRDKHKYSTHKGSHKRSGMHTLCIATQFPLLMKHSAWFPLVVDAGRTRPVVNRNSSPSTGCVQTCCMSRPFSQKPVQHTKVIKSSQLPGKLLHLPLSRMKKIYI